MGERRHRTSSFGCVPADRWASSLEDETASNLASILEHLQAADIYVEAMADSVAGAAGWWSAVTGLELWKAVCRLHLLGLQPSGRLMRSLLTEEEEEAAERDAARPQSTPVFTPQQMARRRPRWSPIPPSGTTSPPEPEVVPPTVDFAHRLDRLLDGVEGFVCRLACAVHTPLAASLRARLAGGGPALMAVGEALHISQPIAHLLFRLATLRRRPGSARRPLPGFRRCAEARAWVYAILIEVVAYALCRRAATLTARAAAADRAPGSRPTGGAGYRGACTDLDAGGGRGGSAVTGGASGVAHNEEELRHRWRLLMLLLLRPLALGLVRRSIGALAPGHWRGDGATKPSGGRDDGASEGRGWAGQSGSGGGRAGSAGAGVGWVQRTLELIDSIDAVQPRYSGSGGWA